MAQPFNHLHRSCSALQTDRQMDRRHHDVNSQSYCVTVWLLLKIKEAAKIPENMDGCYHKRLYSESILSMMEAIWATRARENWEPCRRCSSIR